MRCDVRPLTPIGGPRPVTKVSATNVSRRPSESAQTSQKTVAEIAGNAEIPKTAAPGEWRKYRKYRKFTIAVGNGTAHVEAFPLAALRLGASCNIPAPR